MCTGSRERATALGSRDDHADRDRHALRDAPARGRLAARPRRGRRRRPVRRQVPRRRPGPARARGRVARRRARPGDRPGRAGPRAWWTSTQASGRPSPTRRSTTSSPRAPGLNLGMDFLPGALTFNPAVEFGERRHRPGLRGRCRLAGRPGDEPGPDRGQPEPARLARPAVAHRPRRRAVHPPHVARPGHARPRRVRADRGPRPAAVRVVDRGRGPAERRTGSTTRSWPTWPRPCPTCGCRTIRSPATPTAQRAAYGRYLATRLDGAAAVRGGGGPCPNRRVTSSSTRSCGSSRASSGARA